MTLNQAKIIFIILIAIIGILAFTLLIANRPKSKWKNVINPTYEDENMNVKSAFSIDEKKKNIIAKKLEKIAKEKKLDEKIERMYNQAGMSGKKIDDFIFSNAKFVVFAVLSTIVTFFAFQNIIISLVTFIAISPLHLLEIFSNISERKQDFKNEFPFFLKTLSFVLENGSSLAMAFRDVTEKTKDGVLKEVMLNVLEVQKINGGDFISAFKIINEKVKSEEAEDFVEAVQNSYEKGVPIAKTFGSQSEYMSRFINNNKMKKVNNLDNKMMIPLIMIFGAVALMIWAGLSF